MSFLIFAFNLIPSLKQATDNFDVNYLKYQFTTNTTAFTDQQRSLKWWYVVEKQFSLVKALLK